jgi:hypothetical protein
MKPSEVLYTAWGKDGGRTEVRARTDGFALVYVDAAGDFRDVVTLPGKTLAEACEAADRDQKDV